MRLRYYYVIIYSTKSSETREENGGKTVLPLYYYTRRRNGQNNNYDERLSAHPSNFHAAAAMRSITSLPPPHVKENRRGTAKYAMAVDRIPHRLMDHNNIGEYTPLGKQYNACVSSRVYKR